MSINMTDVTFHIDETLGHEQREAIRDELLAHDGIMAAASQDKTPHLLIIEYDPDKIDPVSIQEVFKKTNIHAERLGCR
ncbi:ATP-binding protein [Gammaproteobacteria bacterium]|nr:ATP-binding protein [Gammaproteobacteria bacterium]